MDELTLSELYRATSLIANGLESAAGPAVDPWEVAAEVFASTDESYFEAADAEALGAQQMDAVPYSG